MSLLVARIPLFPVVSFPIHPFTGLGRRIAMALQAFNIYTHIYSRLWAALYLLIKVCLGDNDAKPA